jgi:hypothetical protein
MALMSDSFVQKGLHIDIIAGLIGGVFHDVGNSITHRYEDKKRRGGHAEIGAWLFHTFSTDILSIELRDMAAYAIAAHTHYPRPLEVEEPKGYKRQPYPYGLWFNEEGKPYGLAPILTRYCDRLDLNGGITHLARHFIAEADAVESGGKDFTGTEFVEKNWNSLTTLFLPEVRENRGKPPTILEWMDLFARSGIVKSIYSEHDYNFPVMASLMLEHQFEYRDILKIISTTPDMTYFDPTIAKETMKKTLQWISGAKSFPRAWENLEKVWGQLKPEIQARWMYAFRYVESGYVRWINTLIGYAKQSEFAAVAESLATFLLTPPACQPNSKRLELYQKPHSTL